MQISVQSKPSGYHIYRTAKKMHKPDVLQVKKFGPSKLLPLTKWYHKLWFITDLKTSDADFIDIKMPSEGHVCVNN